MASATVGNLRVTLSADAAPFSKGMKGAEARLGKFNAAAKAGVAALAAVGAAAAGVAASVVAGVRRTLNEADKMAKAAQSIGVPIDELSRLKHAADLSGVSFENLQTSVARLSRAMSETASGAGGQAAKAFEALGVSVKNTDGSLKSSSAVLAEIAEVFSGVEDGAQKTALAMDIFGRSGASMIPMLNAGRAGLDAMKAEADALGIVLDSKTGAAAERFNDNLTRLGRVKDGIITKLTAEMAPALERVSQNMIDWAKNSNIVERASSVLIGIMNGLQRAIWFVSDNFATLVRIAAVFAAMKVVGVVASAAVAFVTFAKAIRAAGLAMAAFNVVKGVSVRGLAIVGGILAATTIGFEEFGNKIASLGRRVGSLLPDDLVQTASKLMNGLGLNTNALTAEINSLNSASVDAEGTMRKLNAAMSGNTKPEAGGGGGSQQSDPLEQQREMIAQRLALIREGFMTEQEMLIQKYEEDRNIIDGHFQMQLEKFQGNKEMEYQLAQEHNSLMEQLENEHQGKLAAIRQAGFNSAMTGTAQVFNSLGRLVQSGGKKNVKMARAFGIAEALISTFVAANKAMAFAATAGPAAAFGAYASVAAKGLAAVASIRSISDTGGGGGGASAGGGSFSDSSSGRSGGGADRSVYVTLQGQTFGRDQVRDLLGQINEYVADGGQVVLA